jgi:putative ATPase
VDLFDRPEEENQLTSPLADRIRPQTLDEIVGQEHLLKKGAALRRAIEGDHLPSMIFWGPPGSGKTTLARVIANTTRAYFEAMSAVLAGVKDLREAVERARQRQKVKGKRSVLFIDEIHRFNKAQQDALLPHVETGLVTLIGATTENPSFEVISALLSRCRVFTLNHLEESDLKIIIKRALADEERGLGGRGIELAEEAEAALIEASYGDARRVLNTLEMAAELFPKEEGKAVITAELIEQCMQHRSLLYDKSGEEHYNVISAFIKSMRGSDPDAAVYWMTRMVESGEDPLFILRRMIIFASEDIGNADPTALLVASAAVQSFQFVGMPEGILPMSQAVIYLALAPKNNSTISTWMGARADIKEHGPLPVPLHLRNAPTGLMAHLGYGKDYKYPHNFEGHYLIENYLPEALSDRRYFSPSPHGRERELYGRLMKLKGKG